MSDTLDLVEAWYKLGNKWSEIARQLNRAENWVKKSWKKIMKSAGIRISSENPSEIKRKAKELIKKLKNLQSIQPNRQYSRTEVDFPEIVDENLQDFIINSNISGILIEEEIPQTTEKKIRNFYTENPILDYEENVNISSIGDDFDFDIKRSPIIEDASLHIFLNKET